MSTKRRRKQLSLPHVPESAKLATGNPILAFRVKRVLLQTYVKHHGGREQAIAAIRRHMALTAERAR